VIYQQSSRFFCRKVLFVDRIKYVIMYLWIASEWITLSLDQKDTSTVRHCTAWARLTIISLLRETRPESQTALSSSLGKVIAAGHGRKAGPGLHSHGRKDETGQSCVNPDSNSSSGKSSSNVYRYRCITESASTLCQSRADE
jgi:hypothetical protein